MNDPYSTLVKKYENIVNVLSTKNKIIYSSVVTETRNGDMDLEYRKNVKDYALPIRVPVKRISLFE